MKIMDTQNGKIHARLIIDKKRKNVSPDVVCDSLKYATDIRMPVATPANSPKGFSRDTYLVMLSDT